MDEVYQKDLPREVLHNAYAWLGLRDNYRTLIGVEEDSSVVTESTDKDEKEADDEASI